MTIIKFFIVIAVSLFIGFVGNTNVEAAELAFEFEHNCNFLPNCAPIGMLYYLVDIPNTLPPNAQAPLTFDGVAVEALAAVPICPTIRYGGNGLGSVPATYTAITHSNGIEDCYGKNTFLNGNAGPIYFTTPSTPGTYSFCGAGGMSNQQYQPIGGYDPTCDSYTVAGALVGTIAVTANNSAASWTISGPVTVTGNGSSQNYSNQQTGNYTITWGAIPGFVTPAPQSFTLAVNGTITFSGNYANASAIPTGTCRDSVQRASDYCPGALSGNAWLFVMDIGGTGTNFEGWSSDSVPANQGLFCQGLRVELKTSAQIASVPLCGSAPSVNLNFI